MASAPSTAPSDGAPPVIRITRGAPDREELAALTLALLSRSRPGPAAPEPLRAVVGWRPGRERQAVSWAVR